MEKQYSLAYLTVNGCSPPEMIHIAKQTGYDFVGLRLITMGIAGEAPSLVDDQEMLSRTKAALKETGIKVLDMELARILDDVEPSTYLKAMEVAADLGAKHVISSAWIADHKDKNFIIDRFAEICDLAKPFNLTVNLEFPTFSSLTSLTETIEIVRAADRSNGGILFDTLYTHFSKTELCDIERVPSDWLNFIHICDAPKEIPESREGMIHIARDERLYLGEGSIDFSSILSRLAPVPYSIELPNTQRVKEFGFEEHARRCLVSARHQLEDIRVMA